MPVESITEPLDRVLLALRSIRLTRVGQLEEAIVDEICKALQQHGIGYHTEVKLAPGCRIDITVPVPDSELAIGIEVKKSRPNETKVSRQVARYAASGRLTAIVFVAERAFALPHEMSGIPVRAHSLDANFGISL